MHFATLATTLTTLLAAATTTMALPADANAGAIATNIEVFDDAAAADLPGANATASAPLAKRWAYNKVRYCQHANGGGRCVTQAFRHGLCYNMDPFWNDRVSSVYPAHNTRCRLHLNRDCRGTNVRVGPNFDAPDLKRLGFNDIMSSIDCVSSSG